MVCYNPPIAPHHYVQFEPPVLLNGSNTFGAWLDQVDPLLWFMSCRVPTLVPGSNTIPPTPHQRPAGIPGWYHGYIRVAGLWSRGWLSCGFSGIQGQGNGNQSSWSSTHDRIRVSVPNATGTFILCLERSLGRCRAMKAGIARRQPSISSSSQANGGRIVIPRSLRKINGYASGPATSQPCFRIASKSRTEISVSSPEEERQGHRLSGLHLLRDSS